MTAPHPTAVAAPTTAALRTSDRWVTFVTRVAVTEEQAEAARAGSVELSSVAWFAPDQLPDVHSDAREPLRLAGVPVG